MSRYIDYSSAAELVDLEATAFRPSKTNYTTFPFALVLALC